jgi:hypothetical protein
MMNVSIRVSLGEFLDKLSILAIKLERITDDNKIEHIKYEHTVLQDKFENLLITNNHQIGTMKEFYDKLKSINQEIWDIENTIRELEAKGSYGEEFIETARNIYFKPFAQTIFRDLRHTPRHGVNLTNPLAMNLHRRCQQTPTKLHTALLSYN